MPFFENIREIIEVHQWTKYGSHPNDLTINGLNEARVVKLRGKLEHCDECEQDNAVHGQLIDVLGDVHVICPNDWVRTHRDDHGRVIGYSRIWAAEMVTRYIPYTRPEDLEE